MIMKTGIQAIIQKIDIEAEQHGNERRDQIKHEIDEEINARLELYHEEMDKRRELFQKHSEREYLRLLERLSSKVSRDVLTYQHNLIDQIFDMAAQKLRDCPAGEFAAMFGAAVKGFKGKFTLFLGEYSDGMLDQAAIDKAVKSGGGGGLEITLDSQKITGKSGFVMEDDRVEYNCLFEDLIEKMKNEQAAAILEEVFA
jgi:vacuolar-type H+-ATPase subunit E/Vma4